MSDLLVFVGAVGAHWYLLVTGIGSLLVSVAERLRKDALPAYGFGVLGLALLFFACFGAWQDEHQKRIDAQNANATVVEEKQALQRKLDDQEPNFTLHIELAEILPLQSVEHRVMWGFIVGLEVVNSGGPSICEYWEAALRTPHGDFKLTRQHLPEGMPYLLVGKNKALRFHQQSNLLLNTAGQRIERYAKANGVMGFSFPDLPEDILPINVGGNDIVVSCKAPNGKRYGVSIATEELQKPKDIFGNYETPNPSSNAEALPKSFWNKGPKPDREIIR